MDTKRHLEILRTKKLLPEHIKMESLVFLNMKHRRSDIAKLVSAARDIWRQSETYQLVKRESRDPGKSGWYVCTTCRGIREVIKIDHIKPIGKQPESMEYFGQWLSYLFCSGQNLSAICTDCHKRKTKEEARLRKEERKRLKEEVRK